MSITAKVIEDSVGPAGVRLTTLELTYPRFIHAEFMTHRVFSRNASSSRAIPVRKVRERIRREPAMPVYWGKNQAGMQAAAELQGWRLKLAKSIFLGSRYLMLGVVWTLDKLGLHKQLANRLLEPWSHITVVVTATEWDNFFALRDDKHAQPEMQALARAMKDAMRESRPVFRSSGEWHLPYVKSWERATFPVEDLVKFSVARCARVSYLAHDGHEPVPAKDIALHDDLCAKGHMSPFEHQAESLNRGAYEFFGNLRGWLQYRKTLPGEAVFKRS